ncbi:MAG TPA: MarR family transcriptional regulator [Polyangiaceae bacterium]|jgi:DNA-binding MarR family transcriptional regulator|nr:MarR family transcriptional regulator [Polyangiaceae bacterium]
MSREHLEQFLAERVKDLTPERREIIASVIDQSRRSSTRSVVFHAAIAERLGLNPSDHKCADYIANESGPVTAGRLAELTGLSTGAITGVVDRLERAGFVSRVPDPKDRRKVVITGCVEGRLPDVLHLFLPLMAGMATVCENYSDDELKLIVGFMRRCSEMVEERIQALRNATSLGSPAPIEAPAPVALEPKPKKPAKQGSTRTLGKR